MIEPCDMRRCVGSKPTIFWGVRPPASEAAEAEAAEAVKGASEESDDATLETRLGDGSARFGTAGDDVLRKENTELPTCGAAAAATAVGVADPGGTGVTCPPLLLPLPARELTGVVGATAVDDNGRAGAALAAATAVLLLVKPEAAAIDENCMDESAEADTEVGIAIAAGLTLGEESKEGAETEARAEASSERGRAGDSGVRGRGAEAAEEAEASCSDDMESKESADLRKSESELLGADRSVS